MTNVSYVQGDSVLGKKPGETATHLMRGGAVAVSQGRVVGRVGTEKVRAEAWTPASRMARSQAVSFTSALWADETNDVK